jgi:hypothetical protein
MPNYSIYLTITEDEKLKTEAKRRGLSPQRLIKEWTLRGSGCDEKPQADLRLEAVFLLLEKLAPEIGFIAGANRVASSGHPQAAQKGSELEAKYRDVGAGIRFKFESKTGPVNL